MNGILSGVDIYSFSNGRKLSIQPKHSKVCKEDKYRLFVENSELARSMSTSVTHPLQLFTEGG